jgi:hypothetical protein
VPASELMDQGRACGAPPFTAQPISTRNSPAPTDVLAVDRLVSPVPLPPDCPASPARFKGGLRPSPAIDQTALDP